jgi:NitT/TauT family transport system substrate-binding protein
METTNAAILPAIATKQADLGVTTEPLLTQGIVKGLWGEPFFNVPKELGPYAYSTINVRKESVTKEPAEVKGFVRAMIKGLRFTHDNPGAAAEIAKKEFPTMPLEQLQATLKRSFDDEMWSKDGMVSPAAWDTAKAVVMEAGILTKDIAYDEIIDMQFVKTSVSAR